MGEAEKRREVDRLIEGLNAKNPEVMNEVFTNDSVMTYPQSGEVIRGAADRQDRCQEARNLSQSFLQGLCGEAASHPQKPRSDPR